MSAPLLLSFEVSLVAIMLAGVLGIALAALLASGRLPGSDFVEAVLTAPMVLPPTVLGYYLLVTLGRQSPLGGAFELVTGSPLVFTKGALVLAASFSALPFVVKTARAAIEGVDKSLIAAASTLGASPLRVFFAIVLPQSQRGIFAGLTLGFARALGDFGVTLMVAGNIPGVTQTAALAIYDAVQAGRESEAAGLAAVMTALAIAALYIGQKLVRGKPHGW